MSFASTSIRSFTVLTEDDGVLGSKFEREPEYYTVDQLKRWLKCGGLKQGGKREEILKRVKDYMFSGSHRTLDSSIDDGKWFALKAIKENSELKGNNSVVSLPVIPTTGWREFQSHDIPSLFNYGHIHYYALESIKNVGSFSDDDGLRHMTDKPMKNGRKYVDSSLCSLVHYHLSSDISSFFPHINHFYSFTSLLHGLQDVENHCVHLRGIELKTGRKILYLRFPHVLFSI